LIAIDSSSDDTQFIDINGCRLEVRCSSALPAADYQDERPIIVLLHEGLGCVELWRRFPQLLMERTSCTVVAYSRAGYGKSDPVALPRPLDYMTREATDVLPLMLDAIGARKAILVGHSDGASIAAINAGSTTDYRVRGVVLIAPHFFTEAKAVAAIAQTKHQYATSDLRQKLVRYHQHVDVAFNGWCDAWLDPGFADWNVADCIDYIRVPVLGIQGTADEYGTLAQLNEIKSRIYAPFEETIIADCRHSPHLDAPDATLSSISSFVERLFSIEQ